MEKTNSNSQSVQMATEQQNLNEVLNTVIINLLLEAGYDEETIPSFNIERTEWDGGISITIEDEYKIYVAYGNVWQVELLNGNTTLEMRDIFFCSLVDENANDMLAEGEVA